MSKWLQWAVALPVRHSLGDGESEALPRAPSKGFVHLNPSLQPQQVD